MWKDHLHGIGLAAVRRSSNEPGFSLRIHSKNGEWKKTTTLPEAFSRWTSKTKTLFKNNWCCRIRLIYNDMFFQDMFFPISFPLKEGGDLEMKVHESPQWGLPWAADITMCCRIQNQIKKKTDWTSKKNAQGVLKRHRRQRFCGGPESHIARVYSISMATAMFRWTSSDLEEFPAFCPSQIRLQNPVSFCWKGIQYP